MASITTRAGKGTPLTNTELDANFSNLNTELGQKLIASSNLSDLGSAATARSNLGLGNVENKSSATIRGELTSSNVTTALGYTPLSNATSYLPLGGGTVSGAVSISSGTSLPLNLTTSSSGPWALGLTRSDAGQSSRVFLHNGGSGWAWIFEHNPQFYNGGDYSPFLHSGNYSSYALPLSGGTLTGSIYFPGNGSNYFAAGNGDAATLSSYNFMLAGWNGMAFYNPTTGGVYPNAVSGVIDFRNGIINMKGGFQVNGSAVLHAGNYTSYALPLSGGTVDGVRIGSWTGGSTYKGVYYTGMSGSEYMIINRGDNTYISAVNGYSVYIRGGANSSTYEIGVSGSSRPTVGGNVILDAGNYTSYAPSLSGGSTIAGVTYFSNGESINLYGIRGRFSNEYIHLYNKVGIGHPSGWGSGEGNTPSQGLSTYGGLSIAYGNGAASVFYGGVSSDAWGASSANNAARVLAPSGASGSWDGTPTGAIKIRLPQRANNTMWRMTVKIYNYNGNDVHEYHIGNYSYSTGGYNVGASFVGASSAVARNVRWGNDGSYDCVWIGETDTSWSYPVVAVTDFTGGFRNGNASNWAGSWDVSIVTSFGTVSATVHPAVNLASGSYVAGNTILHTGNYTSYSPSLTGSGASGTWGISITGTSRGVGTSDPAIGTGGLWVATSSGLNVARNNTAYTVLDAGNYSSFVNYGNPSSRGVYQITNWNQQTYQNAHFLSSEDATSNAPSTDYTYGFQTAFHRDGASYRTQMVTSLYSDTSIWVRNSVDGDSWRSWKLLLHSGNYSSYALPLSGGSLTGRVYTNNWIEFSGYQGLYEANNAAYFYSNNASYGAWRVAGSRNGWGGISFDGNNGIVTLMMNPNSDHSGFHNNNYGWQFYWAGGTMHCFKSSYGGGTDAIVLDSANYSSYALPLSGGTVTGPTYFRSNPGNGVYLASVAGPPLQAYSNDGGAAYMSFHRSGAYAVNFGLDPDNVLRIGGWSAGGSRWVLDMAGNETLAGSSRAPVFYDSNDTGYYVDPNGSTVLNNLYLDGRNMRTFEENSYVAFTVGGDANTYYPVRFNVSAWYHWGRWSISRGYADAAPWDPIGTGAHHGGLTLTWEWSGDGGWGGNDHSFRVVQFSEQYTTMVGGMSLSVNGMIVWLRGGNAAYRFHGPGGMNNSATPYYSTYTASDGSTFAPRSYSATSVNNEVYWRFPVRNTGTLYEYNYRVLHEDEWLNNKFFGSDGRIYSAVDIRSPIYYDHNNSAYYIDPSSSSYVSGSGIYYGSHGRVYDDGNFHIDGFSSPVWINSTSNDPIYLNNQTSGYTVMGNSARSPIFYDQNNTWYYVDGDNTSNLNTITAARYGTNVGSQSPNDSHPGYGIRPFYSWNIGQAYNATSGYSNGITIGSHPSDQAYGFQIVQNMWDDNTYTRRYNGGWQGWVTLLGTNNYTSYTMARDSWNGNLYFNNDGRIYATILYDTNSSGYYCDPASTSRLGTVQADEVYTYGWFRSYNNTGVYNTTYAVHMYAQDSEGWCVTGSGGSAKINFRTNYQSTLFGTLVGNTSYDFGFLNQNGNWRVKVVGGDYVVFDGSSIRSRIVYDYDDTTYYSDKNGGSGSYGLYTNSNIRSNNDNIALIWGNDGNIGFAKKAGYTGCIVTRSDVSIYFAKFNQSSGAINPTNVANYTQTNIAEITPAGAAIFASSVTSNGSPSDERLKENIVPLQNALATVLSWEGVTFDWREGTKQRDFVGIKEDAGVIAQKIQSKTPHIVSADENGELSVRDRGLIAYLIEAVKEQQQQIEAMRAEIIALKLVQ